ncbi:hypothetical protein [Actomonas aquatica]|uniref:Uncharacterized protein n=1 Tax=Actomonas aquatica TaxID=2866162 RepID=A0ABZ1CF97_9BACT|nr:hypothetical protein [Opitutus sp. WL0086]WRQ89903.1 hypothetical protein K1X11_010840 [Opitutus sp. WL0086]
MATAAESSAPLNSIDWFARHAVGPGVVFAPGAQRLVLFAVAAEIDNAAVDRASAKVERFNNAELASRRQQAENRRKAHFKSDNRVNT